MVHARKTMAGSSTQDPAQAEHAGKHDDEDHAAAREGDGPLHQDDPTGGDLLAEDIKTAYARAEGELDGPHGGSLESTIAIRRRLGMPIALSVRNWRRFSTVKR